MLVIQIKEGDNIEKALKKYKKKFEKAQILIQLRERKHYEKRSVTRRKEIQKAIHRQEFLSNMVD